MNAPCPKFGKNLDFGTAGGLLKFRPVALAEPHETEQ
jgi:hypothetical protein